MNGVVDFVQACCRLVFECTVNVDVIRRKVVNASAHPVNGAEDLIRIPFSITNFLPCIISGKH